ncbi:MAG: CPBP family intramembrane metalloprotease [Clostridia bacterium]|nr:CPBP family intramembrane metalloprotease [Clostridia bacterium]
MRFKDKYPVIVSIIATAVILFSLWLVPKIWFLPGGLWSALLFEIILMIIPFVLLLILGDLKVYIRGSITETAFAGAYLLFGQLMLFGTTLAEAVKSPDTNWVSAGWIVYGVVELIGVGFREETVFRGIVTNQIAKKYIKDRKGVLLTALVSAVIFGFAHMTNVFYGVNLFSALVQSLAAVGIGFYLSAVYLRGGNIWVLILMHTITDAASLFYASFTTSVTSVDVINDLSIMNLTPLVVFGAAGLFLLRKSKCAQIIERYNTAE